MDNNGNESTDPNSMNLSVAYVDAANTSIQTNARERWAVALDWYYVTGGNDNNPNTEHGYVSALLPDGTVTTLRNMDGYTNIGGFNASGADGIKRGDVFTYNSADGTPESVTGVTKIPADFRTLVQSVLKNQNNTYASVGVYNQNGVALYGPNGTQRYYSPVIGSNYYVIDGRSGAAPLATTDWNAAVDEINARSGWTGTDGWDVYYLTTGGTTAMTTMNGIIFVRRDAYIDNNGLAAEVLNTPNSVALGTGLSAGTVTVANDGSVNLPIFGNVNTDTVVYTNASIIADMGPMDAGNTYTEATYGKVVLAGIDLGQMLVAQGHTLNGAAGIIVEQTNDALKEVAVWNEADGVRQSSKWSQLGDSTSAEGILDEGELYTFGVMENKVATFKVFVTYDADKIGEAPVAADFQGTPALTFTVSTATLTFTNPIVVAP
jgi:hypothetical protein